MALTNHSMLEEVSWGLDEAQEAFDLRIGAIDRITKRRKGNPQGCETPLGHTYSLILEELAAEGLDSRTDVQSFIGFVAHGQEFGSRNVTFKTPTYMPVLIVALDYARNNGLSAEAQKRIAAEIIGPMSVMGIEHWFR